MKQRVKFALADIRYIQTEIEKILNPPNSKGYRVEMAEGDHKSGEKMSAGSPRKVHNFSTSPRQNAKGTERQTRMTSPKMRKKQSPQSKSQALHASTIKKDNNYNKNIVIQATEERKVERKESPPQVEELPKEESKEVSPHKSIMMMWKEKEKSGATIQSTPVPIKTNTLTKIKEVNQQKTPKMKVYQPPKEQFKPEPVIVIEKKEVPYHLKETNSIPLRTDESFLIKKYHYNENKQKQEELREKYKLLDERLQKLKGEIKNRDFTAAESGDNQRSKQSSALKKNALEKYSRYSPLSKFVRINEKLRRDYERSLSNQERRVIRERAELQQTKPKWAH